MTVDIRTGLQAGSVAVVAAALTLGAFPNSASAVVSEPQTVDEVAVEVVEQEEPEHPFDPSDMAAAAKQAKKIELQRAKRAKARAQRSSGDFFTPTRNYQLTARYGQPGSWSRGYHTGLDFAAPSGTPVFAALAGKVIEVGWAGAYGNNIVIEHANGLKTRYAHLSATSVSTGDKVTRGQHIGAVGNTGNSTGAHLHFEAFKGEGEEHFRNPAEFL